MSASMCSSAICAATCEPNCEQSNAVSGPVETTPLRTAVQKDSRSPPPGAVIPMPVTATSTVGSIVKLTACPVQRVLHDRLG